MIAFEFLINKIPKSIHNDLSIAIKFKLIVIFYYCKKLVNFTKYLILVMISTQVWIKNSLAIFQLINQFCYNYIFKRKNKLLQNNSHSKV